MPSVNARIARIMARMNSIVATPAFAPVAWQRFMFSSVAPRVARGGKACALEQAGGCSVNATWIVPPGAPRDRAILYLHGGGYVIGSIASHRKMVAQIAEASGSPALAIDYALAPERRFPGAVEDTVAAYRWLLSQGNEPGKIIVMGDSAGGGLTAATLVSLREQGEPMPAAGVMLSPWTDLEVTGETIATRARKDPMLNAKILRKWGAMYAGDAGVRHPLASPIYADLSGLPPLKIYVGDDEILLDDARRLAERARQGGVEVDMEVWPHMWHVWQFFSPAVPESREAIAEIGRYCRERFEVS